LSKLHANPSPVVAEDGATKRYTSVLAFISTLVIGGVVDLLASRVALGVASAALLLTGRSFPPDAPRWYAGRERHDDTRRAPQRSRGPADAGCSEGGDAVPRAFPWMRRNLWIGCDLGADHVRMSLNVRGT
jgi:MFS transporter, SP family, major inositol transporter